MNTQTVVLVVDDEESIIDLMKDFLESDGFQVLTARNSQEALHLLDNEPVDCVLLDVMMPGDSGFDFCRHVRKTSNVPILFLSAKASDVAKIRGLGLGGDDYIVKSATPSEIVARIKAVLRRVRAGISIADVTNVILDFGHFALDVRAHEVRVAGQLVPFPAKEFALLRLLAENPHQVFTRDQLFERLWGEIGDRHTVAVHIGRIRDKIEIDPTQPRFIVTVWGVGYRFEGRLK